MPTLVEAALKRKAELEAAAKQAELEAAAKAKQAAEAKPITKPAAKSRVAKPKAKVIKPVIVAEQEPVGKHLGTDLLRSVALIIEATDEKGSNRQKANIPDTLDRIITKCQAEKAYYLESHQGKVLADVGESNE